MGSRHLLWLAPLAAGLAGCPEEFEPECSVYDEVFVYADLDGDGFGSDKPLGYVCSVGENEATNSVDCDDTNASINPGMEELCDLLDNNCNDLIDETHAKVPWYPDRDGDAFGATAEFQTACRAPGPEFTQVAGDCDDTNPATNPTTPEICNDRDDDCDGRVDDRDPGIVPESRTPFYRDRDQDGYGDPEAIAQRCELPAGFVENALDCDDRDDEINPDAEIEFCDFIDNDCDGFVDDFDPDTPLDEEALREFACDADGDGFGHPKDTCLACRPTPGIAVTNRRDCDDTDFLANIPQSWFADQDLDGVGAGDEVVFQCLNPNKEEPPPDPPLAPASKGIDCGPDDASIYPGAHEECADSIDQDCSGADCASCLEYLNDGFTTDGVYDIDIGNFNYEELYCDMTTDGGGWTLVGSTFQYTMNDAAIGHHDDLTTLFPTGRHEGVYNGLRSQIPAEHDLRFACKQDVDNKTFDVDLSFYEVPWYQTITTGGDAQSNFSCCNGAWDLDPPPARKNNLNGDVALKGDQWDAGYLEGEDDVGGNFSWQQDDFTVDFDDRGKDSNQLDGTDWGEDDGYKKCKDTQTPSWQVNDEAWFIFVRESLED